MLTRAKVHALKHPQREKWELTPPQANRYIRLLGHVFLSVAIGALAGMMVLSLVIARMEMQTRLAPQQPIVEQGVR